MYVMKRTSLFFDDKLLLALGRVAKRRRVSVASLIREAVANYLADPASAVHLPSVAGRFSSGMHDTADRNEELLWREPHQ